MKTDLVDKTIAISNMKYEFKSQSSVQNSVHTLSILKVTFVSLFLGPGSYIAMVGARARVGAQSGLGPSPGWGPVRVGAHMGPYGPLCFFQKCYLSGPDGSV